MQNKIYTHKINTPLGDMIAAATDDGLCLLEFADRHACPKEIDDLKKLLKAEIIEEEHVIIEQTHNQIDEYFQGTRKEFSIKLNTPGTEFQTKVWSVLMEIPYGKTRTYKDQAIILGNSASIRAVGKANGDNRIAIIIPCHRVIGINGDLIGYGGGLWRKHHLLEFEAKINNNFSLF
ncbi:MAG: cysteine methyltransferase [Ignavibacteria bacterium GWB2_35_12]|nr:MAG: cysteine methyltransferase [Ignavibacteria bacterium GWA2_35_8]OGU42212.1 MAG: cysteine methyltransferase [Ignavibacteria bacterium GWB2_35_12]OGU96816.1 MAG: cysteine methyltransferase [Ignavibacteria bacterium RIFOXYA2_FULL_35_10]OGV18816.1 MAG: cysteine methyltransferase [Ignavibacteria bacterium RIFOXYC2_FULL_35_21]